MFCSRTRHHWGFAILAWRWITCLFSFLQWSKSRWFVLETSLVWIMPSVLPAGSHNWAEMTLASSVYPPLIAKCRVQRNTLRRQQERFHHAIPKVLLPKPIFMLGCNHLCQSAFSCFLGIQCFLEWMWSENKLICASSTPLNGWLGAVEIL